MTEQVSQGPHSTVVLFFLQDMGLYLLTGANLRELLIFVIVREAKEVTRGAVWGTNRMKHSVENLQGGKQHSQIGSLWRAGLTQEKRYFIYI